MRRVVSVWLPDWPVTVSRRAATAPPADQPFALVLREGSKGLVLHALNPAARAMGLTPGQSHADACAILPSLVSAPARPEDDAAALHDLALWCERWSPIVAVDGWSAGEERGREGLFLDLTGAAHLFGGEAAFLHTLLVRLAEAGVPARAAMADTPGAAWALARHGGRDAVVVPPGGTRAALAPLPVEALRLELSAAGLLRRFGLHRIGDLYALPRGGLARRFRGEMTGPRSQALVLRLDQALGDLGEALTPVRPAPRYRAWQVFQEPLIDTAGVELRVPELAEALAGQLARDGRGARRLALVGYRVDGRTTAFEIGLGAPSRGTGHILRLLREKGLERLDLGFGVDALMLSAVTVEGLDVRQAPLHGEDRSAEDLAALLDRLEARLGEGAVRRPVAAGSWLPERSERWLAPGDIEPEPPEPEPPVRPLLLLDPPEAVEAIAEAPDGLPAHFTWRRVRHRIARAEGPERLSPEWWRPAREPRLTRDYYRVEDEAGRRYWLFRGGLYGAETDAPRWWMHGVFP